MKTIRGAIKRANSKKRKLRGGALSQEHEYGVNVLGEYVVLDSFPEDQGAATYGIFTPGALEDQISFYEEYFPKSKPGEKNPMQRLLLLKVLFSKMFGPNTQFDEENPSFAVCNANDQKKLFIEALQHRLDRLRLELELDVSKKVVMSDGSINAAELAANVKQHETTAKPTLNLEDLRVGLDAPADIIRDGTNTGFTANPQPPPAPVSSARLKFNKKNEQRQRELSSMQKGGAVNLNGLKYRAKYDQSRRLARLIDKLEDSSVGCFNDNRYGEVITPVGDIADYEIQSLLRKFAFLVLQARSPQKKWESYLNGVNAKETIKTINRVTMEYGDMERFLSGYDKQYIIINKVLYHTRTQTDTLGLVKEDVLKEIFEKITKDIGDTLTEGEKTAYAEGKGTYHERIVLYFKVLVEKIRKQREELEALNGSEASIKESLDSNAIKLSNAQNELSALKQKLAERTSRVVSTGVSTGVRASIGVGTSIEQGSSESQTDPAVIEKMEEEIAKLKEQLAAAAAAAQAAPGAPAVPPAVPPAEEEYKPESTPTINPAEYESILKLLKEKEKELAALKAVITEDIVTPGLLKDIAEQKTNIARLNEENEKLQKELAEIRRQLEAKMLEAKKCTGQAIQLELTLRQTRIDAAKELSMEKTAGMIAAEKLRKCREQALLDGKNNGDSAAELAKLQAELNQANAAAAAAADEAAKAKKEQSTAETQTNELVKMNESIGVGTETGTGEGTEDSNTDKKILELIGILKSGGKPGPEFFTQNQPLQKLYTLLQVQNTFNSDRCFLTYFVSDILQRLFMPVDPTTGKVLTSYNTIQGNISTIGKVFKADKLTSIMQDQIFIIMRETMRNRVAQYSNVERGYSYDMHSIYTVLTYIDILTSQKANYTQNSIFYIDPSTWSNPAADGDAPAKPVSIATTFTTLSAIVQKNFNIKTIGSFHERLATSFKSVPYFNSDDLNNINSADTKKLNFFCAIENGRPVIVYMATYQDTNDLYKEYTIENGTIKDLGQGPNVFRNLQPIFRYTSLLIYFLMFAGGYLQQSKTYPCKSAFISKNF